MKIASVTLCGNNADIIGDALRSAVDQVDLCVVVDTRTLVADGTLEVAEMVCGDKLRVFRKPWRDDFGFMRNAALDCAAQLKADWAIWVDTDERLVAAPGEVRMLAETAQDVADVITCWHESGEYAKERMVRLPRRGAYHGLTHEYWKADDSQEPRTARSQSAARFAELDKSREQLTAKLERDLPLLAAQMALEPEEPRWPYYRGDALDLLGRKSEALQAFLDCMNMSAGWGEMRGWAAFRASSMQLTGGDPEGALTVAVHGMTDNPYPELFFVAGAACHDLERFGVGVCWAMAAVAAGNYMGYGRLISRSGRVHPPALYEAPMELLARCYARMGQDELAEQARQDFQRAREQRHADGFLSKEEAV